jgi:glycosyltransferase involved in cell wall biosynthesis
VRYSVVIPTFNMSEHLAGLVESLRAGGVLEGASEILLVNDGSTDATSETLAQLSAKAPQLREVKLDKNVGRFFARLHGARQAKEENILFLDTRLALAHNFHEALTQVADTHRAVVGAVDIDTTRSTFCLYWDRIHKLIFRKHFAAAKNAIVLTPENFDEFLKGTGVFLCPRDLFVAACTLFESTDLLSDDTYLMREIVKSVPIVVHPDVRVNWFPRETFREFVWRIWDRGPGFVEYHIVERKGGPFFWAVMGGLAAGSGVLVLLVLVPPVGALAVGAAVGTVVLSTALFAQSPVEFVRMAGLHTAVTAAFGAGVVRGLWVQAKRRASGMSAARA